MTRIRIFVAAVLAALALPAAAEAQNASTPDTLWLYPTFESIGIRLKYRGDANANATGRIEWRHPSETSWHPGAPMARITNSRWAGSVMWLTPNTAYEARVVIDDPDGGGTSAVQSVTTRTEIPLSATGRTWWVATNGSDSNDGSSARPLATIGAAIGHVQPGEEVRVRPGIYYEQLSTARSGSASSPIHLVADAPGVILEGADPALMHRTDWRSDGGGIYSIPYTPTANRLVCADSLMRLYKHTSLANLQSGANGVAQGFTISGGRLYVKLEDASSPVGHTMYVARYNVGLTVAHSYWHITGLEVRHFGMQAGGSGFQIWGNDNWIADNYIQTLGGRPVFIRLGGSDNLIERNHTFDPRIGLWPWSATKAHDEEGPQLSNRGGRGNVIRDNVVNGGFDGLDANDGVQEDIAADADYSGNVVKDCADDGIETDTVSGINLRFWGNVFTHNYSCISLGPIYQGPEYVLNNVFVDYTRNGFKFALTSTGVAWICHNTVYSSRPNTTPIWPTGPYSNATFRNNIMVGSGLGACNDDAGESQTGCSFDGDLLNVAGTSTLFRWKGTNYTSLTSLRSGTGFEASGKSGDPMFTSVATGDYTLRVGSPAIDAALVIPGINDRHPRPDIGALESSELNDTIPPGTINDLR